MVLFFFFLTEAVFPPALTSTSSAEVLNEVRGFVITKGIDSGIDFAVAIIENPIITRRKGVCGGSLQYLKDYISYHLNVL